MTTSEKLHTSKTHREGFDPNCPKCVNDGGIAAIVKHLQACALENERDASDIGAKAVAAEQRRIVQILKTMRVSV